MAWIVAERRGLSDGEGCGAIVSCCLHSLNPPSPKPFLKDFPILFSWRLFCGFDIGPVWFHNAVVCAMPAWLSWQEDLHDLALLLPFLTVLTIQAARRGPSAINRGFACGLSDPLHGRQKKADFKSADPRVKVSMRQHVPLQSKDSKPRMKGLGGLRLVW